MRTMDQRKGALVQQAKQIKEEQEKTDNPTESRLLSEKGGAGSTHIDSDSDDS